jgi:hypothetical protein
MVCRLPKFLCGSLDGPDQVPSLRFGNNRRNPCVLRSFLQSFSVQYRKQDQWHARIKYRHSLGSFDPVDIGHCQVDQHHIGLNTLKFAYPRPPRLRFAANRPVPRAGNHTQNSSRRLAIVDNKNSHGPGPPQLGTAPCSQVNLRKRPEAREYSRCCTLPEPSHPPMRWISLRIIHK